MQDYFMFLFDENFGAFDPPFQILCPALHRMKSCLLSKIAPLSLSRFLTVFFK